MLEVVLNFVIQMTQLRNWPNVAPRKWYSQKSLAEKKCT